MKFLVIFAVLISVTAQARFTDAGSDSNTQTLNWSWTNIKTTVVQKVTTFWHAVQEKAAALSAPAPTQVASQSVARNVASENPQAPQPLAQAAPEAAAAPTSDSVPAEQAASLKKSAEAIKNLKVARVAQPAVPFSDKNLIMGHNDVPVFEFKKFKAQNAKAHIKRIPLLNLGTEEVLDSQAFSIIPVAPIVVIRGHTLAALSEPALTSNGAFKEMLGEPVQVAPKAQDIPIPILEAAKKVTQEKIAKLVYTLTPDAPITALPTVQFAADDLKLLRGLILFEKKDQCHIAAGIFSDLLDSEKAEVVSSSHYHLGVCLHEMNLPTEAFFHLGKVIKGKDQTFVKDALNTVLDDVPLHQQMEVGELLTSVESSQYPAGKEGFAHYMLSKYHARKGQFEKALDQALRVPKSDKDYYQAQYLAAVSEYELGKVDASLNRQRTVADELFSQGGNKNLLTLFQMNIGRTAFQKGKFKESLDAFQRVPKENALWMQALQEQAWAQLQSKDSAGAIGNMHSIQSPYFDGVYKPESYVVRSIAYLTICQYPDAYKSLSYLENRYAPWLGKIETYDKTHSAADAYQTVIKNLQSKNSPEVDGLPSQVVREVGHQRDFLNAQEGINQLIDENSGYNFIRGLIEKDKHSLQARRNATIVKVAELKSKIKKANSMPDAMKNYNAWRFELANNEDFLSVYEFKVKTIKEGLDGLNRLAPKAQNRISTKKETLRVAAGLLLKKHIVQVAGDLKLNLENNELLKYEIYAGSGENIRYQMAGGKGTAPDKKTIERKLAGMHWDFDGEYWEDEIGHYRSSLKNNCQANVVGKKGE